MIEIIARSPMAADSPWPRHWRYRVTAKPERQTQGRGWQLRRIQELLPTLFPPDGRVPSNLTDKAVQARLAPVFEKKGWKLPSIDSIARARGRRDNRG